MSGQVSVRSARAALHQPRHIGERLADAVAQGMGSWTFIITQTVIVIGWIVVNLIAWSHRWDPYPFILLNLVFSTQAAYAAPIIMQSQNRQSTKDRARDDLESEEVDLLLKINKQQLELLQRLSAVGLAGKEASDAGA